MAKEKKAAESAVASLNPDEMLSGGLKDDFRGKVVEAVYERWDYDGNIEEPVLAARLTIQPEDEEEPFVQRWSAGDLASFVPSQDGKDPADDDEVGPYALRVGKRAGLNNNTNFAHLMQSVLDAGKASKKFGAGDLTSSLECLEGIDAHWNRVPQKKRSGLVQEEGEKRRASDVLVVTEIYGYREEEDKKKAKAGVAAKKASASKKAKDEEEEEEEAEEEEEEEEEDDLDTRLAAYVSGALDDAPNNKLKKGKLAQIILKAAAKDKDKSKMVKRVSEDDFLGDDDRPWTYDEDSGVLKAKSEDEEEEEE